MSTWLEDYTSKIQILNDAIEDAANAEFTRIAASLSTAAHEVVVAQLIALISDQINQHEYYLALQAEISDARVRANVDEVCFLSMFLGQVVGTIGCYASLNCKIVGLLKELDLARRKNAGKGGSNSAELSAEQLEEYVKPFIDNLVELGTSVSAAARQAGARLRTGQLIPGEIVDIGDEAIRKRYNKLSAPE